MDNQTGRNPGRNPRRQIVALVSVVLLMLAAVFPGTATAQDPASGEAKPAADPQAPAPAEGSFWKSMETHTEVEVGYRWVSDVAGNRDVYRSMVNLGEGPKLMRSRLSMRSPLGSCGLFDRLDLSLNNWGGEPYNTMRLELGRMDLYEFRADYRNLNYYNFIPTHANPLLGAGKLLGQHSLNVTNRSTDLQLKLFPTAKIRPYVGYSRSSGFGPGFTTYSLTGNEFLLGSTWRYSADDFRGGVELALPRLNVTFEQGYRVLRNDSSNVEGNEPAGNNPRPFIGQNVVLQNLDRSFHDRTTLPISRVLLKFVPAKSLSITGRYVYATSDTESNFAEVQAGSLVSLDDLLVYRGAGNTFDTRAESPSHTGGFLVEFSPIPRLTVSNRFDARSYQITGSALLSTVFFNASSLLGPTGSSRDVRVSRNEETLISYDRVRNQEEFEFELKNGLFVRAGHRYTRVETTLEHDGEAEEPGPNARLTRQTAIAGLAYRQGRWLHLSLDYENTQTDRVLTRTELLDYSEFRFGWRVRAGTRWSTTGSVSILENDNGQADIDFSSHRRNYSFAVSYEAAERLSLNLDYSRNSLLSDLFILLPHNLEQDRSLFDERSHGFGGSLGVGIYRGSRVDFGYRGVANLGSYPLNFHQPFATVTIPLHERMVWRAYWQYYGYNEKGASLQDYRAHLFTFSLAYRY